jgi:sugar phosphate isomerase/epimerase
VDVALAPLTVGRPDPEVLVRAAAGAGFRRVGLTLHLPDGGPLPHVTDAAARRRLRALLDDAGVAALDAGVVVLSPATDPDGVARVCDAAAELGADRLIAMVREPDPGRAAALLAAVAATAGDAGLGVGVEFMPYTACRGLADAAALVEASGASDAGIVVDVLHLFRSGGSAADLAGLDPGRVLLLQLCDAPRTAPPPERLREEALSDRRYPGEGELPLADVLAAVPAGTPLTVECPVAADATLPAAERARAAATAVRALLGRISAGAAAPRPSPR